MNQAQSTKRQLFGPRSLGLCAKEKGTLTHSMFNWMCEASTCMQRGCVRLQQAKNDDED